MYKVLVASNGMMFIQHFFTNLSDGSKHKTKGGYRIEISSLQIGNRVCQKWDLSQGKVGFGRVKLCTVYTKIEVPWSDLAKGVIIHEHLHLWLYLPYARFKDQRISRQHDYVYSSIRWRAWSCAWLQHDFTVRENVGHAVWTLQLTVKAAQNQQQYWHYSSLPFPARSSNQVTKQATKYLTKKVELLRI
jgi:hypothetical protein